MSSYRRQGFSLIELLVAIAILGVLAAILFPVFVVAREKGRVAVCASNLRQIGIAFQAYLDDWNGAYPNTDNPFLWMGRFWRWPMKPYLGLSANPVPGDPLNSVQGGRNVLLCPSDRKAIESYDGTSYAYSMAFYVSPDVIDQMTTFGETVTAPGPPCSTQRQAQVLYPSQKALVTEWTSNHEPPNVGWNDPATAWKGGRNYLFADGHCRYLKSERVLPANNQLPDINLTRHGIRGRDMD